MKEKRTIQDEKFKKPKVNILQIEFKFISKV